MVVTPHCYYLQTSVVSILIFLSMKMTFIQLYLQMISVCVHINMRILSIHVYEHFTSHLNML